MMDIVFSPDPVRILLASAAGLALLLLLIIRWKLHPFLALLISAMTIGLGAGMPVPLLVTTIEEGAGDTLQGIVLLVGLGSLFGSIIEQSGGAQAVAQTLIRRFGEKYAGAILGVTGILIGTTVFFEAALVILIPLVFGLSQRTGKPVLTYAVPLMAGLAAGFSFIPPSVGAVLAANIFGLDLGMMLAVGFPVSFVALLFGGILWGAWISRHTAASAAQTISSPAADTPASLPPCSMVVAIILTPLVLILLKTISPLLPLPAAAKPVMEFLGTPYVALLVALLVAILLLGRTQRYSRQQIRTILDQSLQSVGQILLVITGGGIVSKVLQACGIGNLAGNALEQSGLPPLLAAFLIAALIRISVGSFVVSVPTAAGIMASMPGILDQPPLYLAAMACAISGGAIAFSHVNDAGFWLVGSLLGLDEKTTLKAWTVLVSIVGISGFVCGAILTLAV